MSNIDTVSDLIKSLNIFPQHGRIDIIDPNVEDVGIKSLAPGDIVVAPDFMDDDCESEDERNKLAKWYYDDLPREIDYRMRSLGYTLIEDIDGSGGGLYYATSHYRLTSSK